MAKTLIRVGHPAYQGANAMRLCFSKAQAVRVLCNRGVKRDVARVVVNKAMTTGGAYTGSGLYGDPKYGEGIEIINMARSFDAGHFMHSYDEMRKRWASSSEL